LFAKSQGLAVAGDAATDYAQLRAAVGRLEGERDALKLVAECFISILGNVNAAHTLMPLVVENLNKCGYGNLADDLALTGFAAALAADERGTEEIDPDSPLVNPAYAVPGEPTSADAVAEAACLKCGTMLSVKATACWNCFTVR
jgi:hypothetical protein